MFIDAWNEMAGRVHDTAVEKGFWKSPHTPATTELQAALEIHGDDLPPTVVGAIQQAARHLDSLPTRNSAEALALIHSEVSEALEGLRHGDPPDDKVPEYSSTEVELADAVIRIMDFAVANRLDVAGALVAKAQFNGTRPYKHGKQF